MKKADSYTEYATMYDKALKILAVEWGNDYCEKIGAVQGKMGKSVSDRGQWQKDCGTGNIE